MKRLLGCKTQQLTLCWLTDARLGVPLSPNPLFTPIGIRNGLLGSERTQGNVSPGLWVSYSAHLIDCQQVQSVWWRMTNCKKQCWPQCGVLNKLQSQAHIPQTHAVQQPFPSALLECLRTWGVLVLGSFVDSKVWRGPRFFCIKMWYLYTTRVFPPHFHHTYLGLSQKHCYTAALKE